MRKWFLSLSLACGCSLALVNAARAQNVIQIKAQPAQVQEIQIQAIQLQAQPPQIQARVMIMPGPGFGGGNRLTQADAVLVGRVVALEPMDVEAPQSNGGPKATYRIAVVQVSESIFGLKKDTKQVRIGFIANPNQNVPLNGPGGGIQIQPAFPQIQPAQPIQLGGRRPFPGNFQIQLEIGQDGLFTVNKHHKESFYLAPTNQNFVTRQNNAGFDGEVKNAKQLSKVMANPAASLKAEDKQDRYTAAAILINKYRVPTNPTGLPMKQEAIDAEESKLILKALAGGDWTPGRFGAAVPNPFELFNQLGVNQKDGYNPVNIRNQQDIAQAMQKWLDENNGKYRIQRFVVNANAKPNVIDPKQGIQPNIRPNIRPLPPIRIQPQPQPIEFDVLPIQQDLPAQPIRRNN